MMFGSTSLVRAELERFLTDRTADALALIGDWGSGKTYVWNEALEKVKKSGNAARPGYAYVSLFGINSLPQLNVSIFQHSEGMKTGAKSPLEASGLAKLGRFATRFKSITGLKDWADAAEQLMAFEIRDRIVCFDDLERMSPGLSVTELMGLASFLKERRNCKIIFIAHTDRLEQKNEFEKLSEKVVDITLRFLRLPSEAGAIAITEGTTLANLTREKCNDLGIANIRVIRQIWRFVRAIDPMLRNFEPEILNQAVHSLALFGWCRLQPNFAPNEQFVMKRGGYEGILQGPTRELTPDEKSWTSVLDRYGFHSVDEFDKILAKGVADGFFQPDAVQTAAGQKNALIISEKMGNSVTEAWATFHHGFQGTEESVANAIFEAVKRHAKFVSPMNLDSSVRMLKELRFTDMAIRLLTHYIEVHSDQPSMFNLDEYTFAEEVRDPDVREAFGAKANSVPDERDPLDVFIHISKHGVSSADRKLLESLPTGQLIEIFKRTGVNTNRVVKAALEFPPGRPGEDNLVNNRAKEALISIGRESLLNRIRVKRFGITDAELDGTPTSTAG